MKNGPVMLEITMRDWNITVNSTFGVSETDSTQIEKASPFY